MFTGFTDKDLNRALGDDVTVNERDNVTHTFSDLPDHGKVMDPSSLSNNTVELQS